MSTHPKMIRRMNLPGALRRGFSKTGLRFNFISFFVVVVIPVLTVAVYYACFVKDRYVSEAKVLVKLSNANTNKIELSLSSLGGAAGAGVAMREPLHVRDHIFSYDMLKKLNTEISYRKHVTNPQIDFFSRLHANATQEEFHKYYHNHVKIIYDDLSSILTIETDAFSPEYSQQLLSAIIKNSEAFLNESSHQIAREQVQFVEKELGDAQEELRTAKRRITDFQTRYKMVSPQKQAESLAGVIHQLNGELVKEQATLKGLQAFMDPRSLEVIQAKQRIQALQEQLGVEKGQLAGSDQNALTGLQAKFQDLEINVEFALSKYKTALTSLEMARMEAYRKLVHLIVIESPTLPQEALYPRKLYNLSTIFVLLSFLYGIVVMVAATIREHR